MTKQGKNVTGTVAGITGLNQLMDLLEGNYGSIGFYWTTLFVFLKTATDSTALYHYLDKTVAI
ncbi:MAG: hypothetical protein M3342_18220 [Bacteroidota bacterium]|nr:hypothetical protein [Bacteroidota bacterium]